MKQHNRFSQEQKHEQAAELQGGQRTERTFDTPEELLRFDASQTPAPHRIAERLGRSAADIPRPRRSWWKRLWGSR
jgi:hypothetical protein